MSCLRSAFRTNGPSSPFLPTPIPPPHLSRTTFLTNTCGEQKNCKLQHERASLSPLLLLAATPGRYRMHYSLFSCGLVIIPATNNYLWSSRNEKATDATMVYGDGSKVVQRVVRSKYMVAQSCEKVLNFPRLIHNSWPIFTPNKLTFYFFFIYFMYFKVWWAGCTSHIPHALLEGIVANLAKIFFARLIDYSRLRQASQLIHASFFKLHIVKLDRIEITVAVQGRRNFRDLDAKIVNIISCAGNIPCSGVPASFSLIAIES